MTKKLAAGDTFPQITLPRVGGGEVQLGGQAGSWQMVVVYRGAHCPKCKQYLTKLQSLQPAFSEIGTAIVAVSADPIEKAEAQVLELGLSFPVGYGLSMDQMRSLGVYISNPRSPEETDRPFSEPGLFIVNPDCMLQITDISNAPFARPDPENVLAGLKFLQEKGFPIRGTA